MEDAAHLAAIYHRRGAACSLQRNRLSQFVGILMAQKACARYPVSNCYKIKLTSETLSSQMKPQYRAAVSLIVTFLWHYLLSKALWA